MLRATLLTLVAALACVPVRADSPVQSIGIGASVASPVGGPSLLLKFDDRWSGGLAVGTFSSGTGARAQVNYSRVGSRGGYWTAGAGRADHTSIVRAGYGYAWQRGAFRLHLEATLNVPFNYREREGLGGIGEALGYAFPIGLGVHYVFGER